MECKCPLLLSRPGLHIELIDTLWNVNGKQVTKGRMLDFRTDVTNNSPCGIWVTKGRMLDFRINRYIMECKR